MNITININEASSKLAYLKLKEVYHQNNKGKSEEDITNMIFTENENEDIIYTDDAQVLFNEYYDEYYSILLKTEI